MFVTFGIANFLNDNLLCCLSGNTAEINRRQRINDKFADLDVAVISFGFGQSQLGNFVFNLAQISTLTMPFTVGIKKDAVLAERYISSRGKEADIREFFPPA